MICGIDEAGRGALAGPVSAAAVILPVDFPVHILRDSKKLSPAQRESASKIIYARAQWGVGWASHEEIDAVNILQATHIAMRRAFTMLLGKVSEDVRNLLHEIVVDGISNPFEDSQPWVVSPLVRADSKIPEVMAASILAKTSRDREMTRLSAIHPEYGYDKHKAYPTLEHKSCIAKYGPSPIQRRTFKVSL